jgi:MSHA biogenesis protein MshJ
MNKMMEKLEAIQQKIDGLNQRERILLLVTAVVVMVMLLQVLLIDPVLDERKKLTLKNQQLSSNLKQQKNEKTILKAQLNAGINRAKINQREKLQSELEQLNKTIDDSLIAMIAPRLMPEVLEQMLSETKGLKLLSLENKPVIALVEQQISKNGQLQNGADKKALYNHSFVLKLSGNYMNAIQYFEKLSQLPWNFHWDDMHYKVDQYPNATITLEVHTVSMSEEWIGV